MNGESFKYVYIVCVLMASINVSLKREAYAFLRSLKSGNKSFSDVILDFKERRRSVLDFFGILKNAEWKEKEAAMKDFRASVNKRLQ